MSFSLTPKQQEAHLLLGGPQRHTLLVGGARSGKTFLICRTIAMRSLKAAGARALIARHRFNHVKASVWADTWPKMMKLCFPEAAARTKYDKTDFRAILPNGSEVWFAGLDDKDRTEKILGQEYSTIFLNECSQIGWGTVETVRTRLAQNIGLKLRMFYDLNPGLVTHYTNRIFVEKREPIPPYKGLKNPGDYAWMRINPTDNTQNLPPEYLKELENLSARAKQRFLAGEWGSATEGALWTYETIETHRSTDCPDLQRIVVAVDPSGTHGDDDQRSDHVGIVVVGLGVDGHAYVLEDLTCKAPPRIWGRIICSAYERHEADAVVAETNFGGAMVQEVIRAASSESNQTLNFIEVKASRGKVVRAEPVSALYEQGKVHHVGLFPELEDQLCLAAGTLVETDCGPVPIEKVNTHHRVLTRNGFAPVKWAGYTGHASEFIELGTGQCKIRATPSHPVFNMDTGEFVSATNVRLFQRLLGRPNQDETVRQSHGAAAGITGCRAVITATQRARCFTGAFTKRIRGQSAKVWTSIISMVTQAITDWRIWSRSRDLSMCSSMSRGGSLDIAPSLSSAFAAHAAARQGRSSSRPSIFARIGATCGRTARMRRESRLSPSYASTAAKTEKLSESESSVRCVARTVTSLRRTLGKSEPVYNISVADGYLPEFFANGILVHNCSFTTFGYLGDRSPDRGDALIWGLTFLFPMATRKIPVSTAYENCEAFDPLGNW